MTPGMGLTKITPWSGTLVSPDASRDAERIELMKQHRYGAYLLRLWKEDSGASQSCWRFTLIEVGREQRKFGFRNLDELMDFLRKLTQEANGEDEMLCL